MVACGFPRGFAALPGTTEWEYRGSAGEPWCSISAAVSSFQPQARASDGESGGRLPEGGSWLTCADSGASQTPLTIAILGM